MQRGLAIAALMLLSAGTLADSDHDRARAALAAGRILPLSTLLDRLAAEQPGQVLELELDEDDDEWIYEITLMTPDHVLLELDVDARTGRILKREVED